MTKTSPMDIENRIGRYRALRALELRRAAGFRREAAVARSEWLRKRYIAEARYSIRAASYCRA
jgi:hypothetical protein